LERTDNELNVQTAFKKAKHAVSRIGEKKRGKSKRKIRLTKTDRRVQNPHEVRGLDRERSWISDQGKQR